MSSVRRTLAEIVPDFVARAHATPTADAFRNLLLDVLAEVVHSDSALFFHDRGVVARGVDRSMGRHYLERHAVYKPDLCRVVEATRLNGAFVDHRLYSSHERRTLPFFTEFLRPRGITSWLGISLRAFGALSGTIQLARHGAASAFDDDELASARRLYPLASMLHAAALTQGAATGRDEARIAGSRLTQSEIDTVRLVAQGLSNGQIGVALGCSPNTVRNRLVSIFDKVHAQSRVDVARWAQTTGLVDALTL